MALIRCDFFAETLQIDTSMTVLLPQLTQARGGHSRASEAPPVLYLLHGLSDDASKWLRNSSIERYADPLGLAVVMPQVQRSFYLDEAYGNRYWTFLTQELPAVVASFFRVSSRREDTFVAGLSMGGYGALTWALREPDRFAAAASLSGALDLTARLPGGAYPLERQHLVQLFGDTAPADGPNNPLWLVSKGDLADVPPLFVACGTEDFLYQENVHFVAACRERGLPVTVDFGPGDHDWAYWDAKIQAVLDWLPLRP